MREESRRRRSMGWTRDEFNSIMRVKYADRAGTCRGRACPCPHATRLCRLMCGSALRFR